MLEVFKEVAGSYQCPNFRKLRFQLKLEPLMRYDTLLAITVVLYEYR